MPSYFYNGCGSFFLTTMLTVPKLSDTFVYPLYTGTVPVGYSPSRSIMTYPICHTKTQFPPGVAFYLFDQPEQ